MKPIPPWSYWAAGLSLAAMLFVAWGFVIYLIVLVQRGQG
jgi:hypothetical protein